MKPSELEKHLKEKIENMHISTVQISSAEVIMIVLLQNILAMQVTTVEQMDELIRRLPEVKERKEETKDPKFIKVYDSKPMAQEKP